MAFDAFSNVAKPFNLKASWTKAQNFGGLLELVQSVHAKARTLKSHRDLLTLVCKTLGSVLHDCWLLNLDTASFAIWK